ncbi:MerR family transcriptional regulator [Streptomyces rimosus]|uniref:MerR family transcriptional regulator n=1 Tax=Streptomyces rimosus TaxID=1927 RepID=UPI0004CC626F|nr:MerR family transcriptional regulator [Streptomyces rimosus]
MLTIGQLAAHAGVTVRAVRHYHQRGLLSEPARDASGYRRYDAQAVVDLIRIKTLADAGVPLARVEELLAARPEEFAEAVAEIDRTLVERIRDLTHHRRNIAQLAAGDALFLPAEIIDILERVRALGISERLIRIERDVWIMLVALSPRSVPQWVAEKNAALADPDFRALYRACDEALDRAPDDPRLVELATAIAAWDARHPERGQAQPAALTLMYSHVTGSSPAWQRLMELLSAGARDRPAETTGTA